MTGCWWSTQPSETYELVNWDDEIFNMLYDVEEKQIETNVRNHQPGDILRIITRFS